MVFGSAGCTYDGLGYIASLLSQERKYYDNVSLHLQK